MKCWALRRAATSSARSERERDKQEKPRFFTDLKQRFCYRVVGISAPPGLATKCIYIYTITAPTYSSQQQQLQSNCSFGSATCTSNVFQTLPKYRTKNLISIFYYSVCGCCCCICVCVSVGKTSRHVKALPVAFAHGLKPLWSQLCTRSTYNLFDLRVKVAQCCVCHALNSSHCNAM